MKDPLKILEPNLLGRDFVIGDLHGCYDVLQNLLKNINFDPTTDRMISVGDLVDRGPDHIKCLELIREPWFHSVLGNHEQMMISKLQWPRSSDSMWVNNGGQWAIEAINDKKAQDRIPSDHSVALFDLIPLVEELPYLITVKVKSGKKFHIIHAEFPTVPVPLSDEILSSPDDLRKIATIPCYEGDSLTWHRCIFYELYERDLSNRDKIVRVIKYNDMTGMFNDELSHIICGHTTLHQPITLVGQTCIDTGAWQCRRSNTGGYSQHGVAPKKWAALTCIELNEWKFYQATETEFKEVEPFVVNKGDLSD